MQYLKVLSDYFGEEVPYELGQDTLRFGPKKNCWVRSLIFDNEKHGVFYGNWSDPDCPERGHHFYNFKMDKESKHQQKKFSEKLEEMRLKAELEKQERHKECREKWAPVFNELSTDYDLHPYLKKKKIEAANMAM